MFLFPHSHVPEDLLQRLLAVFPSLVICRPWHLQPPDYIPEDVHPRSIRILYPPSDMKPPNGFTKTLQEYNRWMRDHRDRSMAAFLKSSQRREDVDPSTWELRQMLRRGFEKDKDSFLQQAWRWHVILHLWQDLEVQSRDKANQLRALRQSVPLLQNAVEDPENLAESLGDLPQLESEPFVEEIHYQLVLEAWFGLFGGFLKGEEVFVTVSRGLMDCILQWWNDSYGSDFSIQQIRIPSSIIDTKRDSHNAPPDIRGAGFVDEMRRSISHLDNKPLEMFSALKGLWEHKEALSQDTAGGDLVLTLHYLPSHPDRVRQHEKPLLRHLSNTLIISAEEQ